MTNCRPVACRFCGERIEPRRGYKVDRAFGSSPSGYRHATCSSNWKNRATRREAREKAKAAKAKKKALLPIWRKADWWKSITESGQLLLKEET